MMDVLVKTLYPLLAMGFAAAAGFLGCGAAWSQVHRVQARNRALSSFGDESSSLRRKTGMVLAIMERRTHEIEQEGRRAFRASGFLQSEWFAKHAPRAGLAGKVSDAAFVDTRFRLSVLGGAAGFCLGALLSGELAMLMGVGGVLMGWKMPAGTVKRQEREREANLESHLPEMLDVMALGMHSGLSFDAALGLYCTHFATPLSHELRVAQEKWMSGLESRADALKGLSATYASSVFARVTEAWVRSLRFGTSMVEGLEAESAQARSACKAQREERIAKAPVKMMVPTGVLILPAMLILVLGPVLLELMNGGV